MSFPIFGGSAGSVFWPAQNQDSSAVDVGDVLMLDFDTERDAYHAITPALSVSKDYFAPVGVVQGPSGGSFLAETSSQAGGEFMMKVQGLTDALVSGDTNNVAKEDLLLINDGKKHFTCVATEGSYGASVSDTVGSALSYTAPTVTAFNQTSSAPAAFPSTLLDASGNADFASSGYVESEIEALGDAVIDVRDVVADLVTDVGALETTVDQLDTAISDGGAVDAEIDSIVARVNQLVTDASSNHAILEDVVEAYRVRAIALEAESDATASLRSCYLLGRCLG